MIVFDILFHWLFPFKRIISFMNGKKEIESTRWMEDYFMNRQTSFRTKRMLGLLALWGWWMMNEMGLIFWLQVSTLNSRLKSINSNRTSFNHTARSISASRSNKISSECPKMKRDERLKFCRNLFDFSISFSPGPGSRLSHQEHGIVCVACELRFIVMFEACGGDFGNKLS